MARLPRLLAAVAVAAVTTLTGVAASPSDAASASRAHWVWPLHPRPEVLRGFEPPRSRWGPGHRGVDLAGRVGQQVLAIGAGAVTFAAVLAGRGVVVVRHGELRSTYEPVTALVHRGEKVAAGQPIGLLQRVGSHCLPRACLHLGVLHGDRYLDPLTLLDVGPVRLKPLAGLQQRSAGGSGALGGGDPVFGALAGGAAAGSDGKTSQPLAPEGDEAGARASPPAGAAGSDVAARVGAGAVVVVALLTGAVLTRRQARG